MTLTTLIDGILTVGNTFLPGFVTLLGSLVVVGIAVTVIPAIVRRFRK